MSPYITLKFVNLSQSTKIPLNLIFKMNKQDNITHQIQVGDSLSTIK